MNAIVTGGSRGIGAAVVRRLAASGMDVALVYRSSTDAARQVADSLPDGSGTVHLYQADLSDPELARTTVLQILEDLGPVDVLVNNAGITRDGLAVRMATEQFTSVLETNLVSAFVLCRECAAVMMRQRRGRIINMASVSGIYGNAGQANYAASKAGLIGLTRSLAKELGGRGITVNAVAPGFIETDMTVTLGDRIRDEARRRIPLGRFGHAEEVASVVSFLAGEEAAYVTGQVIEVSGGMTL